MPIKSFNILEILNKNKKQMEFTGMVATDVIESRKPNHTEVMSMKWLLQRVSVTADQ